MVPLNLIPQEKIKLVRRGIISSAARELMMVTAVTLALNAAILFVGRSVVAAEERRLGAEAANLTEQYRAPNKEIDDANRALSQLSAVAGGAREVAALYRSVLAGVPDGVKIRSLNID